MIMKRKLLKIQWTTNKWIYELRKEVPQHTTFSTQVKETTKLDIYNRF